MTLTGVLLVIFNCLLWTAGREVLIEKKRHSLNWAGLVVLFCFITSLISLILFG